MASALLNATDITNLSDLELSMDRPGSPQDRSTIFPLPECRRQVLYEQVQKIEL